MLGYERDGDGQQAPAAVAPELADGVLGVGLEPFFLVFLGRGGGKGVVVYMFGALFWILCAIRRGSCRAAIGSDLGMTKEEKERTRDE